MRVGSYVICRFVVILQHKTVKPITPMTHTTLIIRYVLFLHHFALIPCMRTTFSCRFAPLADRFLARPRGSFCMTSRLAVCCTRATVDARRVAPSVFAFSLSSHRHPSTLFSFALALPLIISTQFYFQTGPRARSGSLASARING